MKKSEIRILEMLVRVRQWILARIAAFPAGLPGHDLYLTIDTSIKNMEKHSTEQAGHAHAAKEKTAQKNVDDDALRDLMEAVSRTARSMSRRMPGIEERFSLPSTKDGQTWRAAARDFAEAAEPIADEFVSRGMAPDFIDDLKTRALAIGQTVDGRELEASERITSTTNVGEAAEKGFVAVRELGAIVLNIYKDNPAELAAWESASHVERAPRRADDDEEEAPPAAPAPAQV
ncbi:MAG: hypothetical protein ACJ754_04440 [Pyrinomonadaceae bacterium]